MSVFVIKPTPAFDLEKRMNELVMDGYVITAVTPRRLKSIGSDGYCVDDYYVIGVKKDALD